MIINRDATYMLKMQRGKLYSKKGYNPGFFVEFSS